MEKVFLEKGRVEEARSWFLSHQQEMTRDLMRMIAVPSISVPEDKACPPFGEACRKMADLFCAMAEEYGFETEHYDYYCARASIGAGEELAFWSHLDVVPAGSGWRFDPFVATETEGYIIGRGAQDNKGSAICVLYLMRYLRETGYPLRHRLTLYVGFNEECGMADAEYFAKTQVQPPLSIVADCAFPVCVGERGTLEVRLTSRKILDGRVKSLVAGDRVPMLPETAMLRCRGSFPTACGENMTCVEEGGETVFTAHGTADHAAMPGPGPNAIWLLADAACRAGIDAGSGAFAYLRLASADTFGEGLGIACKDAASGPLICGVTTAGLKDGRLWFTASIKFPVQKSGEEILGRLTGGADRHGFDVEVLRCQEPVNHERLTPVVNGLTEIYNQVMGVHTEPFVMSGGTYARRLKNALPFGTGLPMPPRPAHLFAPGHGDYHQADECIEIERMQAGCLVYAASVFWLDTLHLESDIYW